MSHQEFDPPSSDPTPHRFETTERRASYYLSRARAAAAEGDGTAVGAAAADLYREFETAGWEADLERSLVVHLSAAIAQAWQRGWQPADVVNLVRRTNGVRQARLTADAIAHELQAYPAVTLDPQWAAQLREIGARRWWAPEETFLRASSRRRGAGEGAMVIAAVEVLCLLWVLPRIERLGPLPGTAPAPTGTAAQRAVPSAPDVDERMLSRIRALLAKAESTTSAAEATAFIAGAQERMARHNIDQAMLAASKPATAPAEAPVARRIAIDSPYEQAKAQLLYAVATVNRCRSVWSPRLGFSTVVGFDSDLRTVETLFTSLLVQATAAMNRAASGSTPRSRTRTAAFRKSFLAGYTARIKQRLQDVVDQQTRAADNESAGSQLLPVLASRTEAVEDALNALFPTLKPGGRAPRLEADGFYSGLGAAETATLGTAVPLGEADHRPSP